MERNIKTLDVSVIGSEIPESYFHPKLDNFKLGEFLWVKLENENYEKHSIHYHQKNRILLHSNKGGIKGIFFSI